MIITSNQALKKECYCLKELDWFCEGAEESRPWLCQDKDTRIFHVRKENRPEAGWPGKLKGVAGYEFFKKSDINPGAADAIDSVLTQIPDGANADEQWQLIARYLEFLIDLAEAEDKEGFLDRADEKMAGLVRQLS